MIPAAEILVFEFPSKEDQGLLNRYLQHGREVFVIEPYHAYHNRVFRFYPPAFPSYIRKLIQRGTVQLITADQVESRRASFVAAEQAVAAVEAVYPFYRQHFKKIIACLVSLLGPDAEKIFQKDLCDRLGDFYSINFLLHHLSKCLTTNGRTVELHTPSDAAGYVFLQRLVRESGAASLSHEGVHFAPKTLTSSRIKHLTQWLSIVGKLFVQGGVSLAADLFRHASKRQPPKRSHYRYGIAVTAPRRQFRDNQRGAGFLIDNETIKPEEVVFISTSELTVDQRQRLISLGSGVVQLPRPGHCFTGGLRWLGFAVSGLFTPPFFTAHTLEAGAKGLFSFISWQKVMAEITFEKFITHCDFAVSHIARAAILKQEKIESWYFTDATNFGLNFRTNDTTWNRHPFWTFLQYDHFVTWTKDLATYFQLHPGSDMTPHIVGCLWSGHVHRGAKREVLLKRYGKRTNQNAFLIAAYTSTYTVNGVTSFQEGIDFATDLFKLVDDFDQVIILVKEKKARDVHLTLDPTKGRELVDLYDRMADHPRISILPHDSDSSQLMGGVDLCISFPFTSTTNEALGAAVPAIWHDSMAVYRETPLARQPNLVTHGYEELKNRVAYQLHNKAAVFHLPEGQTTLDPYCDGKAIERFRALLVDTP